MLSTKRFKCQNKLKYLKDPDTGKRRSRVNSDAEVIEKNAPELRIVTDELWGRVKACQKDVSLTVTVVELVSAGKQRQLRRQSSLIAATIHAAGVVLI